MGRIVMGKRVLLIAVGVVFVVGTSGAARAEDIPLPPPMPPPELTNPPPPPPVDAGPTILPVPVGSSRTKIPTHLRAGNQYYDASVAGLRAYVDSTKATDPQLYAQLAPEVDALEARANGA